MALAKQLLLIAFATLSLSSASCATPRERCLGKILSATAKELKREEGLRLCGQGGSATSDGKMTELSLSFQIFRPLTQDEARPLVIKSARTLRDQINSHSCAEAYFAHFPANEDDISITVYINNTNGHPAVLPYMGIVSYGNGILRYKGDLTEDNMGEFDYKESESLEEALQKLGESQF